MGKILSFAVAGVLLGFSLSAQPSVDCETTLNTRIGTATPTDSVGALMATLLHCGLDSFDLQSFVIIQALVSSTVESGATFTVRDVYDRIAAFKKTGAYRESRMRHDKLNALAARIGPVTASAENWPAVKKDIAEALDGDYLARFEVYLISSLEEHPGLDYAALFADFQAYEQENYHFLKLAPLKTEGVYTFDDILPPMDFDEALAAATDTTKPVLVYFNAYGAAGSRKMEKIVLSDPEVFSLVKNDFQLINLYVDDRRKLDERKLEDVGKKFPGERIKTIGQYNSQMQIVLTNRNNQPHFAVFDRRMRVIGMIDYTPDAARYLIFLREALEEYRKGK